METWCLLRHWLIKHLDVPCPRSHTEHRGQTPHQALWQHQELQTTKLLGICDALGKPRRWPWLFCCSQATVPSPSHRAEAVSALAPAGTHRMSRACDSGLCQLWKAPGCHLFPSHCPVPWRASFWPMWLLCLEAPFGYPNRFKFSRESLWFVPLSTFSPLLGHLSHSCFRSAIW